MAKIELLVILLKKVRSKDDKENMQVGLRESGLEQVVRAPSQTC